MLNLRFVIIEDGFGENPVLGGIPFTVDFSMVKECRFGVLFEGCAASSDAISSNIQHRL